MNKALSHVATLTVISTLAACGGGDNPTAASGGTTTVTTTVATPTDALGQVTGLHTGYLAAGTYTVSHCTNTSGAAVGRQVRLLATGAIEWLDANGNALMRFTPASSSQASPTEVQNRQFRYIDGYTSASNVSNWDLHHQAYQNDGSHTLLQDIRLSRVEVVVRYSLNGSAQADVCATSSNDTVVTIPMALTQALWDQRLGSMAAVAGPSGFAASQRMTDAGTGYTSVAVSTSGAITATRLGNGGFEVSDDWSSYITVLLDSGSTPGSITEYWDNTFGNAQRPEINLVFSHYRNANTSGNPVDLAFNVTSSTYDASGKALPFFGSGNLGN